jgi:hypothetical protein
MNVLEIVTADLKAGGFDGLCCDGCGCGLDDLAPCDGDAMKCTPAKKHQCDVTCSGCCSTGESDRGDACYRPAVEQCGKVSDGNACTMPKGSECPDCCGLRGETIGEGD